MEPKFEPVLPLQPSDPSPSRIADVMGTDYQNYIHCRNSDSKTISYLIGKSADRVALHPVEWGRPVANNTHHERPRVDRSSGLYHTATRKATVVANKEPPRPWHHERRNDSGLHPYECGEDELKNDLYLSPSDDEDTPRLNCTPNNSQQSTQEHHHHHEASVSQSNSTNTVRDLSYWVKKGSEKLEKKVPQPSTETPASSQEDRKPRPEEKSSTTPKSIESGVDNYRDLLKNGLDSLSSNAPALRSGRMLSVLNDTDDEGPAERKEWHPPPVEPAKSAKTYGEWKRLSRRAERAPNSFVDRKIHDRSPKRELVPYSDLDDASEGSPEQVEELKPKEEVKLEPTVVGMTQQHTGSVSLKRKEKPASKHSLSKPESPEKRLRPIKTEPKVDSSDERFRFESLSAPFHIAFPVPSHTASPSHRKRPRRHYERDALDANDSQKIPLKKQPVHSRHTTPDSDLRADPLATTGGFDMASPQSPATDPMVDPNFERNLSDVESDHETTPSRRLPAPLRTAANHSGSSPQVMRGAVDSALLHAPNLSTTNHKSSRPAVNAGQQPSSGVDHEPDKSLSPHQRSSRLPSHSPTRGDRSQVHFPSDATSSDTRSSLIKPDPEKKSSIYHALPKIPLKRPTSEEVSDSKKPRIAPVSSPIKPAEIPPRDATKLKESKKIRHKLQKKSKEPESVKREPSSPRLTFGEVSVTDVPQTGLAVDETDSLAPSLPRVSSAAEFIEVATQCELMPAADRDASETKDTKRLRAVAFRIAGGRGNMSAAEARAVATSGSGEGLAAGSGSALTRRASSTSAADDVEAGRAGLSEEAEDSRSTARDCHQGSGSGDMLDAVIRHKQLQETVVQRENVVYQKMNASACFSEAQEKKMEADRLKSDGPSRFALFALRACYLYIQACYVEERQNKNESASMHYREAVAYVRSTSQLIEQVAKSAAHAEHSVHSVHRARVRHNFITLMCAQMKAIINYRIYCIGHRETARLRPEIERELHRLNAGGNGASERSTPESITRSPAVSGGGLHLSGESLHRLQRYFRYSRAVQTAHEYWMHAMTLRQKHEELGSLEELVFRKSQVICYGPECPVPCFLRYLNTFLTLYEEGEV